MHQKHRTRHAGEPPRDWHVGATPAGALEVPAPVSAAFFHVQQRSRGNSAAAVQDAQNNALLAQACLSYFHSLFAAFLLGRLLRTQGASNKAHCLHICLASHCV